MFEGTTCSPDFDGVNGVYGSGTFGLNNPYLTVWLTNATEYQFGGTILVNYGTLHIIGDGFGDITGGGITMGNSTNAISVWELTNHNTINIAGNVVFGAASSNVITLPSTPGGSGYISIGGAITGGNAVLTISNMAPLGLGAWTLMQAVSNTVSNV